MQQLLLKSSSARLHTHCDVTSKPELSRARGRSFSLRVLPKPWSSLSTAELRGPRRRYKVEKEYIRATLASQQTRERASSHLQASTSDATTSEPILTRKQSQESVADKLIDLFATKTPDEWRKLIAFSKQWSTLADRCAFLLPCCLLCPVPFPGAGAFRLRTCTTTGS